MDGFAREALARMPLAEAVLRVFRYVADEPCLQGVYERFRGRSYESVLSFAVMVHLVADALIRHNGSGRRSFEQALQNGQLKVSIQAAYGKLRRIPTPLSMGFLTECGQRLDDLFPESVRPELPACFADFEVVVLDGKAIKRVAKRLKPLRNVAGGVLGGKALVALSLRTGLVLAMHADPDGDANEVRFLPDLLPALRQRVDGPRLWLADRAFCGVPQATGFGEQDDAFVVRYRRNVRFTVDRSRAAQTGRDPRGRKYVQRWGWLGTARQPKRYYVRQITLKRRGEESIILVTNLWDAQSYPGADILELYLRRWGIERVFQEITEVFGLSHLIGGSPQACIFQLAFCLLLYSIIELVRVYVAAGQSRPSPTISRQKLFEDVREQLIAWAVLVPALATIDSLTPAVRASDVRRSLAALLRAAWTPRWIKAPPNKRRPPPRSPQRGRTHASAYRILNANLSKGASRKTRQ